MNPTLPHSPAEIARVAFSMFVYVADIQKNITPQEVRRFQALINETAWVENDDLRSGLSELRDKYSSFWSNYEDGVFAADGASIAEWLHGARRHLGDERSGHLRRELNRFLERLDHGPYGAKLIPSDQRARSQARKELLTILNMEDEQLAAFNRKPNLGPVESLIAVESPPTPIWPAALLSPAGANVWPGGKTKVRCVSVLQETHDTKTYSFVAEPQTLFHYKAGQFVAIAMPVGDTVLRRCYTISSSPSRPYTLSVTVKKLEMGWMSNWLFDNMAEGVECTINGPAGNFTCLDHPAEKLLFMVAGSGITPAMSMLRWLADTSSNADVVFIDNVRTPDDIIFHQELLFLSGRLGGRMRLAIVPAAVPAGRPWNGPVGRLDETLLRIFAPDFAEREAFVCGPPGYMSAASSLLESLGFPASRYHDESFGTAPPAAAPTSSPATASPILAAPQSPRAVSVAPPAGIPAASRLPAPTAREDVPIAVKTMAPPPSRAVATAAPPAPRTAPAVASPAGSLALAAPKPLVVEPNSGLPQALRSPLPGQGSVAPSSPGASPSLAGAKIRIQNGGASFIARPSQTILEAAEASSVALEHSCRLGICGSCKMRKVSGNVKMDQQTILSEADIGAGYILTCITRAAGDVTLSE
jgi:ferredoxin-NADP reductase/ferredoxin